MFAKTSKILTAGALVVALGACQSLNNMSSGQTAGTLLGAAGGGFLGSQVGKGTGRAVAIAAGTFLGAVVGHELGGRLTETDKRQAAQTANNAFEYQSSGTTSSWRNPDTGNGGTVTPGPAATQSNGQPCREYTTSIVVDGKTEYARGTACRNGDGTWRVMS